MSRQKSILGETGIRSISMDQRHDPSVQARSRFLQCVLEKREYTTERRGQSCNVGTCFCSLLKYARAKLNQRRCSLKCVPQFWTDRCPMNNTTRFFLSSWAWWCTNFTPKFEILDSKVCPLKFSLTRMSFHARSFFTWNKFFGLIVHQIRLNCSLRRVSFLNAQCYLHFHWSKFHFSHDRFPDASSYSRLPGRVIWITVT